MEEFDQHSEHPLEIQVMARDGSIRDGHLVLEERPNSERVSRAMKAFFLWAGAAVLAAFIPVLHFILVPAFVLAAFFMGANALFDVFKVVSGEIVCARCGTKAEIEPQGETYPIQIDCESCGNRMAAYRASSGELT